MASFAVSVLETLLIFFLGACVGLLASNGEYRAQRTQRLSTQEEDFFYAGQIKPSHPRRWASESKSASKAHDETDNASEASEASGATTRLNTPAVS